MRLPAKKRLGQHFLKDTGMVGRIISLAHPGPGEPFLEIGPGEGALTRQLAPLVTALAAIEVDRDRIPGLLDEMRLFSHVRIIEGDILNFGIQNLQELFPAGTDPVRVIGNLPYNIATAIIERLLEFGSVIRDMTLMVQLEVAERMVAVPGTKAYGCLSVLCQSKSLIKREFKVPPGCFSPRPKVMSAVITIRPLPQQRNPGFEAAFVDVVKAAFAHRRKTLLNSLLRNPSLGPAAGELLPRCGIDPRRRAEELNIPEYRQLADAYLHLSAGKASNIL
jgi:16S rRNA (adenine1518-N6/adenine1519-N6)-dimethyltransferase